MGYKNINVTGALITASRKGQLEIVEYMLSNGADIHASDDLSLRFAISGGHFKETIETTGALFLEKTMEIFLYHPRLPNITTH